MTVFPMDQIRNAVRTATMDQTWDLVDERISGATWDRSWDEAFLAVDNRVNPVHTAVEEQIGSRSRL